jgi:hypothetical protein
MMRAPDEAVDLRAAEKWLAGKGLRAARFSKTEIRQGRTPDFRIYRGDRHVGFCEVKSPRDDWLDDQLAKAAPSQLVGGSRPDPGFNRLSHAIAEAVKQFDAVNPDRKLPNVLVFINWADGYDVDDLRETLTGYREGVATMTKISDGRMIGVRKSRVDLYVWIDGPTGQGQGGMFSEGSAFQAEVCGWLDPGSVG